MLLGKIVRSNSHTDYVCQVYGPGEVQCCPTPRDHAFGTFVRIALPTQPTSWLVGLIYDTVLLNPDFGRLGPRLSPQTELAVFSPDYLNEKAILVGITTVGTLTADGRATQGVPPVAAMTDALVERMADDEVRVFHNAASILNLAYAPLLLSRGTPLAPHLLRAILSQLSDLLTDPAQAALLALVQDDLLWQSQIGILGGTA